MSHGHPFWFLLIWMCVVWYSTVTIYVAYQGARDIKAMFRRLRQEHEDSEDGSK